MALFKILRGQKANLPSTKTDGRIYVTEDTGEMFLDTSASNRVQLNTTVAQNAVSVNGFYPLLIKNTADNQTNEVNAVNYTTDVLVRVSDNGSHLCIGEPTMGLHATNKSYVDGVVTNYLPRAGGNMTGAGPIQYPTDSGNGKQTYYISAGGGYSPASGKYGVKLVCCDQVDTQTGLGQDLTGLPGGYELSIAGGRNGEGTTGYISFAMHSVNSTDYDRLGYFDNGGNFYTKSQIYEGGTALSNKYASKLEMNTAIENAIGNAIAASY